MCEEHYCPKCGKPYIDRCNFGTPDNTGIIGMINHLYAYQEHPDGQLSLRSTERCFLTQPEWDRMINEEGQTAYVEGLAMVISEEGDMGVFDQYYDHTPSEVDVLNAKLKHFEGKSVVIKIQEKKEIKERLLIF